MMMSVVNVMEIRSDMRVDDVQIEINLTPLESHCLKDSLLESI